MNDINTKEFKHFPVMKKEAVENLKIKADGIYADLTLGGGSHAMELAKKVEKGRIIAIDRDADALEYSREKLKEFGDKIIFVKDNYANIGRIIEELGIDCIDGALMDCGVSSYQLDTESRGFSYMRDGALDMRMDQTQSLSAAEVINDYTPEKLRDILYNYGEERYTNLIIREIIKRREVKRIETTAELADIIKYAVRNVRYDGGHPAKRTFQAIRIAVNGEIDNIAPAIESVVRHLKPGGRFVAITFQSIEDRAVKRAFVDFEKGCICPPNFPICVCENKPKVKIITRKPILPSKEELEQNSRSASAKMRVLEKL